MSFVHLHNHSEFSLLDGACRIKDMVKQAKAMGQTAVAITDHGVMYGVVDFYRKAKAEGIHPVIGCEVYVAPWGRSRIDRTYEYDADSRHLVLLCENEEGYRNLCRLVSAGFTEGFYIKPRVDLELLKAHSGGLIALSGCLGGEIPKQLMANNYEKAKEYALIMEGIFGKGNFYLELQDHGIPEQREVLGQLHKLSQETGIPMVATNDAHYLTRKDATTHDILLCIQTGKTVDEENRMRFQGTEFYLKTEEEMTALFSSYEGAIENTQIIANRCQMEFEFGVHHLPEFKLPPGWTDGDQYFAHLCHEGFLTRFPHEPAEYQERLTYEMNMIKQMGFVDYFLIVSDFIRYAKDQGIPVGPGRGSAAGSIVAYCLDITDVDPMKYNLYFERFLNPERVTMPDIDIDFCIRRRQEVIEYVQEKYGHDHVAQIVTFGTMAARGVLRDVGRALNVAYAEVDQVAKQVPSTLHITLDDALKLSKELKDSYDNNPTIKNLVDSALEIEGMPRHASTHAAGVVITRRPVVDYVPLAKNDESVVTQYVMTTLEELGLLKMDFLGLRNLTILNDAVLNIQKTNPTFSMADIPEEDSATFQMLGEGKTAGVFQMESAGMTGVCVGLKPQSIEDITAIIALYRPGPMESIPRFIACKQNPQTVTYKDPLLEPILSITYGCIVYQEQVIEIFRKLGGYTLGQADMVRRAISKKKKSEIEKERHSFIYGDLDRGIGGCVSRGISPEIGQDIYNEIYDFANYAFNKAHAVSYAIIAYQTAWFKCHYTREYMAALLTSVLDYTEKVADYIGACKDLGIDILPPDINQSGTDFTVVGEGIRFGLVAIKGVGRGVMESVLAEREKGGTFISFPDFCQRMSHSDLNKRVVERLISCGAFDTMGIFRSQLMAGYEQIMDSIARTNKKNLEGQYDLFGTQEVSTHVPKMTLADIPEYSLGELMRMEKESTGLYFKGHPMDEYRNKVKSLGAVTIGSVVSDFAKEEGATTYRDGQKIKLAGVVSSTKTKTTRNQSLMAYVTIDDGTSFMELLVFSRVLSQCGPYLYDNSPIFVEGKISVRDDKPPQVLCDRIQPMCQGDDAVASLNLLGLPMVGERLYLRLPSKEHPHFTAVKELLAYYPGQNKMIVKFQDSGKAITAPCAVDGALVKSLISLLGQENVVVQ